MIVTRLTLKRRRLPHDGTHRTTLRDFARRIATVEHAIDRTALPNIARHLATLQNATDTEVTQASCARRDTID